MLDIFRLRMQVFDHLEPIFYKVVQNIDISKRFQIKQSKRMNLFSFVNEFIF